MAFTSGGRAAKVPGAPLQGGDDESVSMAIRTQQEPRSPWEAKILGFAAAHQVRILPLPLTSLVALTSPTSACSSVKYLPPRSMLKAPGNAK